MHEKKVVELKRDSLESHSGLLSKDCVRIKWDVTKCLRDQTSYTGGKGDVIT